ncbi:hypothetical protein [Nocardioides sp.]|uniref:hypothetical protein n=1 Tax=Nocardioides sp. TaxID=35761 RepID=UPI0037842228
MNRRSLSEPRLAHLLSWRSRSAVRAAQVLDSIALGWRAFSPPGTGVRVPRPWAS